MQKKAEISNQTLGLLLVLSIALSVVGTFISLSKVSQQPTIYLTGYALQQNTSTAIVNLTVDQVLDINFTVWQINWGAGSVIPGNINCSLTTISGLANDASCQGFANLVSEGLTIENIGNQNVSLNLSFDKNAAAFIGGQSPGFELEWRCDESSACRNTTGNSMCAPNSADDQNFVGIGGFVWSGVNTTINSTNDYTLCPNLDYDEDADAMIVNFNVVIPEDSFSGNLTTTVTATAYVVDAQQ